jgi:hypothetical protein
MRLDVGVLIVQEQGHLIHYLYASEKVVLTLRELIKMPSTAVIIVERLLIE